MVMSVINHIRGKYLMKNEKCSMAKAIEILAVHYGNGNNLVKKGVPSGILPHYFTDEQMEYFRRITNKIIQNPTTYNNMRIYDTLEKEIRKIMVSRNELEEEIKLLNTMDRIDGVKMIDDYLKDLEIEYDQFKKNNVDENEKK